MWLQVVPFSGLSWPSNCFYSILSPKPTCDLCCRPASRCGSVSRLPFSYEFGRRRLSEQLCRCDNLVCGFFLSAQRGILSCCGSGWDVPRRRRASMNEGLHIQSMSAGSRLVFHLPLYDRCSTYPVSFVDMAERTTILRRPVTTNCFKRNPRTFSGFRARHRKTVILFYSEP